MIMMMMMISCIMPISCRLQLSVWIRELCEGWSPRLALLVTKNSLAGHLGLDQTGVQDCLQYHSTWLYNQSAIPFHLVGHLGLQFIQPTCSKSMDWLKRSFTGNLMLLSSKFLQPIFEIGEITTPKVFPRFSLSQGPKAHFFHDNTTPRRGPAGWWKAAGRSSVRRWPMGIHGCVEVPGFFLVKFPGLSSSLLRCLGFLKKLISPSSCNSKPMFAGKVLKCSQYSL